MVKRRSQWQLRTKGLALFPVLFVVLALAASCSAVYTDIEPESVPAGLLFMETKYVLVDEAADDVLKNASAAFAQELNGVSGFAFQLLESRNPLTDFEREDVCFAFLDSKTHGGWTSYSGSLCQPFQYSGYEHYTMSLNSKTVLELMERDMERRNMAPLAAFYQGSDFLLSTINLDDYSSFQGVVIDGETEAEPGTVPTVCLSGESAAREAAYLKAGAITGVEEDSGSRLKLLLGGGIQAAEFSFQKDAFLRYADLNGIFFTRSWQNTDPLWLVSDRIFWRELAASDIALVKEVVAGLFPKIDGVYLEQEDAMSSQMSDNRAVPSTDFARTRQKLDQDARDGPADSLAENKVLEYIREVGALS